MPRFWPKRRRRTLDKTIRCETRLTVPLPPAAPVLHRSRKVEVVLLAAFRGGSCRVFVAERKAGPVGNKNIGQGMAQFRDLNYSIGLVAVFYCEELRIETETTGCHPCRRNRHHSREENVTSERFNWQPRCSKHQQQGMRKHIADPSPKLMRSSRHVSLRHLRQTEKHECRYGTVCRSIEAT